MNRSSSITKEKKKVCVDSSSSLNKSAKRKASQTQYITLLEAIEEQPQCFDGNKIALVQKFINQIDLLPTRFHKIETLYLSSNNIKSLEGLEQFSNLKNLSLANNNIDDSASLNVLTELPTIEVLNLNGNPICRLPNYRSLIISLVPCLKSLDGKSVSIDDKNRSDINLRTQSGLLDLLLRNYCELIKLNSLNQKLEVHKELLSKHQRFARNYAPMDVPKWKKAFDLEKQLDTQSKNILKANLLKDVDTIKRELELKDEENDTAFSELILRQQQKISELISRAEDTVKNISGFNPKLSLASPTKFNDIPSALKSSTATPLNNNKAPELTVSALSTKPKVSKIETSASLLDCEPKSLKSILKSSVKSPNSSDSVAQKLSRTHLGTASTDKFNVPSKFNTPAAKTRGKDSISFPVTKDATQIHIASSPLSSPFKHGGPSPLDPPPGIPHKEECCRSLHKQIDQLNAQELDNVWTSLTEANRAPSYKKKLEEKVRLIENLTRDLRIKNQELIKYESINHQMAEKLRNFQNQNRENVRIAQYEIDKLTRELETSLEAQHVLEEAISSIKQELEDLYVKAHDLEDQNKRLVDIEVRANQYKEQLEARILEETNNEKAVLHRTKKLKVKAFKMFKQGIRSSKVVNRILNNKRAKKQKKTLCLAFSSWKRTTVINSFIREKTLAKNARLQSVTFHEWVDYAVNENKIRGFITDMNERKVKKSMVAWKQLLDITAKKRLAYKKALLHFIKKTKKRAFKKFVDIRKRAQYDAKEEKAATKRAQTHKIISTRRNVFAAWKQWIKTEAKPLRLKNQKSDNFRNKNLLKVGLKFWLSYMSLNQKVLEKAQRRIVRKNLELTTKCLKAWKYFFNAVVPQERQQEAKKEMFIKKRLMKIWVDQLQAKKKVNASIDQATKLNNKTLITRVFKHLAKLRLKRKQLHFYKNVIQTKVTHSKTSQCFSKWSALFKKARESKREAQESRIESLTTYFQAWKNQHKATMVKKGKLAKLENHLIKAETNFASKVFGGWFDYSRQRRRNREVLELLAARKATAICKNVMFELVKNARQSLKVKMNKVIAKSSLLEAHMRDNVEFVKDLDEERNQMQDKTNQYKHELGEANQILEDKNREINNLKRVLQQYEKNEKNFIEELNFKGSLVKELEVKIHRGTSESQYINGEYEKEIECLKAEKLALQKKVVTLEEELEFKHQSLVDTEKKLVDKANEAQNLLHEAERKAVHSFKVASEMRNEVDSKEEEVTSLLARLQLATEEKEDLKLKLAEALNATKDTREFYEGRVRFLEKQNNEMLNNMDYFKEDMSKQQKLISDLKSDLRTSQHKLEVVRNRSQLADELLVKELRRNTSRSPSFGDHPEAQSPLKSKASVVDTFRKECIADSQSYKNRKDDIDRKLATLELHMSGSKASTVKSPPNRIIGNNLSIDVKGFASSTRTKKTDSTKDNESILEASTKDLLSPLGILKASTFTPSMGSARLHRRDRSPVLTRSALGSNEFGSGFKASFSGVQDPQIDRVRRERQEKREGLEKRMEVITQSIQADLHKARNRILN